MSKKQDKAKERDWDRRPWPAKGDESVRITHESIGRTLSMWENIESALSLLFANFVGNRETGAARRAYCAVRTFEGRAEMLRAASEAYFTAHPDKDLQDKFVEIWKRAKDYSPRRNDIAHGVVQCFYPSPSPPYVIDGTPCYALYPSYASFKDRDVNNVPTYCYTSAELDYFYEKFYRLNEPIGFICGALQKKEIERASLERCLQQDRMKKNQHDRQTD